MEYGISNSVMVQPLVSVIIGTKDRPLLIMRAINTILAQTYPNFECLVIDCGSSDETLKLVNSIEDKRVTHYKLQPDPGRVESLTYGINLSKGDYITFLDDDDEYMPDKLELQVKVLERSPENIGMAYCWSRFFDEGNNKHLYNLTNNIEGYVFENALEVMAFCSFPTLMLKRKPLIEIGLTDQAKYPSDWLFVARFTKKYNVVYVPKVLVKANINHVYDRMSAPRLKDKEYYMRVKGFHIHFYSLFEEDYNKSRGIAMVHLYPLISVSAYLRHYADWAKYAARAIRLNPFNSTTYIKILRSIGTLLKLQK
jgi:glycosyltransferase involved in cell wall biosynthesis